MLDPTLQLDEEIHKLANLLNQKNRSEFEFEVKNRPLYHNYQLILCALDNGKVSLSKILASIFVEQVIIAKLLPALEKYIPELIRKKISPINEEELKEITEFLKGLSKSLNFKFTFRSHQREIALEHYHQGQLTEEVQLFLHDVKNETLSPSEFYSKSYELILKYGSTEVVQNLIQKNFSDINSNLKFKKSVSQFQKKYGLTLELSEKDRDDLQSRIESSGIRVLSEQLNAIDIFDKKLSKTEQLEMFNSISLDNVEDINKHFNELMTTFYMADAFWLAVQFADKMESFLSEADQVSALYLKALSYVGLNQVGLAHFEIEKALNTKELLNHERSAFVELKRKILNTKQGQLNGTKEKN